MEDEGGAERVAGCRACPDLLIRASRILLV